MSCLRGQAGAKVLGQSCGAAWVGQISLDLPDLCTVGLGMGIQIGVPCVVENITGAGGTVGAARVARAKADGHTLLLGFTSNIGTAPLVRSLPYDPTRDFAPVGRAVSVSLCITAHAQFPANNMQELVALAKQQPE